jgi:hypothetical protein
VECISELDKHERTEQRQFDFPRRAAAPRNQKPTINPGEAVQGEASFGFMAEKNAILD